MNTLSKKKYYFKVGNKVLDKLGEIYINIVFAMQNLKEIEFRLKEHFII